MAIPLRLSTRRQTIIATTPRLPRCARNDRLKWVRMRHTSKTLPTVIPQPGHGKTAAATDDAGVCDPRYPGNSVIEIQHGRFPNGLVSSGVNSPESGLTLKVAMIPDSWPAE